MGKEGTASCRPKDWVSNAPWLLVSNLSIALKSRGKMEPNGEQEKTALSSNPEVG